MLNYRTHIISECQLKICSQQIVLKFMVLELQCEASLSMANLYVQFCLRAKRGGGCRGQNAEGENNSTSKILFLPGVKNFTIRIYVAKLFRE
jgi:hypothetical protein